MNVEKLLKTASVLMIAGGVTAAATGIISILSIKGLVALLGTAKSAGLLGASAVLVVLALVVERIAGLKGTGSCSPPQKAAVSCAK